jgi:fructuronate reductase
VAARGGDVRLSLDTVDGLDAAVRPRTNPRSLPVGIVHLGIGAFHRAHQAVYTEGAIAAAGGDWGICGVTERSPTVVDQLGPQDGLYTVAQRDADGEQLRVIGAIREVRWAQADPRGLLQRIADPAIGIVTLTVSEKGYRHDPATNRLRVNDPAITADLERRVGLTVIGQLALGLDLRRRGSGAAITVVCCDNLPDNGRVLAGLVSQFADRLPDADRLLAWIERNVRFPSTMVDRITPATTGADRSGVADRLGVRDEGVVVTEPFSQWVIQDDFAGDRPAWEAAGAILTADVGPYERIKLRLLNGSHSTIAYLGALADHEFVADAVNPRTPFLGLLRALMVDDVAPTLAVPDGFDLVAYRQQLLDRFGNPALQHRTLQIAMDGSQKLPQRLLGTIADRRRAGAEPSLAALGVAGWMRFVSARRSDGGRPLPVDDPLADEIGRRLRGREDPTSVVDTLLAMPEIFGAELAGDPVVCELLYDHLGRLIADGAERTARRLQPSQSAHAH